MNAEVYRGEKWIDLIEFESYKIHKSGRVILRGVTYVKSFGVDHVPLCTVALPADTTLYIKERD